MAVMAAGRRVVGCTRETLGAGRMLSIRCHGCDVRSEVGCIFEGGRSATAAS